MATSASAGSSKSDKINHQQGYLFPFPPLLTLLLLASSVDVASGVYTGCQYDPVKFNPEIEVQRFGNPTAFVYTKSINLNPYSLTDPYRQSALYHEYLLIGPGYATEILVGSDFRTQKLAEAIHLVIYDADGVHSWRYDPNIVQQNLGKEYNWALINATGMLPSLTVVNTTFERTFRFNTQEGDTVSYHMEYPNIFRSPNAVPPIDVLIEFPAKTRKLLTLKTMIDYQTFGLLRWKLTNAEPVKWNDLVADGEFATPNIFGDSCNGDDFLNVPEDDSSKKGEGNETRDHRFLLCMYQKKYQRVENPCIKDMFLLKLIRGHKRDTNDLNTYHRPNKLYIIIPMVYDVLNYDGWYDLTEVYCARPDEPEECGNPSDVVLTNDHLLILTDKGLYVSSRLSQSRANVSLPYNLKPLLKFTPIDPCASFDRFNCSQIGAPILGRQAITRQRLFYTPVCHLFQYPVYEDIVMLVIEHSSQAPDLSHEQDLVTVLYAARPYTDWKVLFYGEHQYITSTGPAAIEELLGIFFNHHRRHFDITLLLNDDGVERTIRFVLPEPEGSDFEGYTQLDGLLGNGFLEFEFPQTFHMTHFNVNPEPLDIFFLGDQMWIAEAGGAFVYLSVPTCYDHDGMDSYFESCSFNHPDRTFVCSEKTHAELYVGRIGVTYSPIAVDYKKITEMKYTMIYNLWPLKYVKYIAMLGHFTAGYSGKIMLWIMYDHNELVKEQIRAGRLVSTQDCHKDVGEDKAVFCHICKRMKERTGKQCVLEAIDKKKNDPRFRMLAFDPAHFDVRDSSTHGPLIPFLVDGDKVVVFEADIPYFEGFKPDYNYLQDTNVGNRILCSGRPPSTNSPTADEKDTNAVTSTPSPDVTDTTDSVPPTSPTTDDNRVVGSTNASGNSSRCPEISLRSYTPTCELYIRHMKLMTKKGEQTYLDGIRRSFYATVVKSFPMKPVPTAVVVLILADTNHAIIQLDISQFKPGHEFIFSYEHIGQTLYIPEHMSILLTGFPVYKQCSGKSSQHDMTRMVGYATRYYRQGKRIQLGPFHSFLINLSTIQYCQFYQKSLELLSEDCSTRDVISEEYEKRRNLTDQKRKLLHEAFNRKVDAIEKYFENEQGGGAQGDDNVSETNTLFSKSKLTDLTPDNYSEIEEQHLAIRHEDNNTLAYFVPNSGVQVSVKTTRGPSLQDWKCPKNVVWQIIDGGCHLRLYLANNKVLKQNGGRVSLDKYDSLSFTLKLRSLTPLGKSLIHRPLMSITNTNPDIIDVENRQSVGQDPQVMEITLTPTGLKMGVATVTVRPLIVSTDCAFADGSFSLLIQVQRMEGRRLHVNYPIPECSPEEDDGQWERPWKKDLPSCVTRKELLTKKIVRRPDNDIGQIFYAQLPDNYRPPSFRGPEIPVSINVYNVDPAIPNFKDWYLITKESGDLLQCAGKETKEDCTCSENDKLSNDIKHTDCKRMVYTVKRGFRTDINVEYDRFMRDEDQHPEFFSPKKNWSIYVEEVNDRTGYTLTSSSNKYLEVVSEHVHLHQGNKFYDARTLGVTLHGTGLFHFKVSLGEFESFGKVSGYFMMFCVDHGLNHMQFVVIMLLTITVCMVLVFCGFLIVRSRLSSQLPYQTMNRNKIKLD